MRKALPTLFFLVFGVFITAISTAQSQKLRISDNGRFLTKEDKSPFIWIGETNWFFAKLPPKVIDSLLDVRSAQGYTVMSISCREKLYNGDGPGTLTNPNEKWWKYLDEYIAKCEQRGLYVALTLGWWSKAMRNSEADLYKYGKWVGTRYKDHNNIIWLTLGEAGSHKRKKEIPVGKLRALVRGIREGDTGNKLLSIHADYQRGTSLSSDSELCDFNNWQTGQWCCPTELPRKEEEAWTVWDAIQYDYEQLYDGKAKPTLDAEAWYENNKDFCYASPFSIRRRAYFTIFAGAFGHTYGAGGIWDGLSSPNNCSGTALAALQYPGAQQIGFLSLFLHSLEQNFLKLIPAQSLVTKGNSSGYEHHIQSTKAQDGSFALIYSASDKPYQLSLTDFQASCKFYAWYNPRNHKMTFKTRSIKNTREIVVMDPPGENGAGNDWVLIIGSKKFIRKIKRVIANKKK